MAKLNTAARKRLKKSEFGLPEKAPKSGSYPMPDKNHAANAKGRAAQQVKKGNLSRLLAARIDAKANAVLGKGKAK